VFSTCLLAAVRSPLIFSPDAFLPENVKTGMVSLSLQPYISAETPALARFSGHSLRISK